LDVSPGVCASRNVHLVADSLFFGMGARSAYADDRFEGDVP
jgi:hypothetical protein